jgi:hypothetical protein
MGLDKFEKKIQHYENKVSNQLNNSKKTTLYSIGILILSAIIIASVIIILINPLWLRDLKKSLLFI